MVVAAGKETKKKMRRATSQGHSCSRGKKTVERRAHEE